MLALSTENHCNWLCTGKEIFPEMLNAIDAAERAVCLESYIYSRSDLGDRFLRALTSAAQRGVRVRVLVDALGSANLPDSYWDSLRQAGGEARFFNPLALNRMGIRDHRKLLVIDSQIAFVGGFNIAPEYEGDGISCGWCDIGMKICGRLAAQLEIAFDQLFSRADFRHKRILPLRKRVSDRVSDGPGEQLLLSGPGWGANPIKRALRNDLSAARDVRIIAAYFLPTWRIRRDLARVVRRGGSVSLLMPGKSDVVVSQLAAQSLYRRFLKAGIRIYEYQPQILHAKLIIIDDVVYVGSANLDQRSLHINYELMIRLQGPTVAAEARKLFEARLEHCKEITPEEWRRSRSLWKRLKQRWAYLLLVRLDPYIARWQWRALPD